MNEHRTKTYLFRSMRDWATGICQSGILAELENVNIQYADEGSNWVQVLIRDHDGSYHHYTIKVTENMK